jgi:endo-1,4-beta-xylanase
VNDDAYRGVLRREFDIATPENAMKWDTIHPRPHRYHFADARSHRRDGPAKPHAGPRPHARLARAESAVARQSADVAPPGRSRSCARTSDASCGTTGRDVAQWDVVNEPFEPASGALRDSPWLRAIGPDYIELAFRFAHRAAPHAKLYLNEFGLDEAPAKLDGLLALVADLRARGVPIDGVGFQSHGVCLPSCRDTFAGLATALQRTADLGVAVALTELDVLIPSPSTSTGLDDQATAYARAIDACLAVSRCRTVVMWGVTDRYSRSGVGYAEAQRLRCRLSSEAGLLGAPRSSALSIVGPRRRLAVHDPSPR